MARHSSARRQSSATRLTRLFFYRQTKGTAPVVSRQTPRHRDGELLRSLRTARLRHLHSQLPHDRNVQLRIISRHEVRNRRQHFHSWLPLRDRRYNFARNVRPRYLNRCIEPSPQVARESRPEWVAALRRRENNADALIDVRYSLHHV